MHFRFNAVTFAALMLLGNLVCAGASAADDAVTEKLVRNLECKPGQDCENPPSGGKRGLSTGKRNFSFEVHREDGLPDLESRVKSGKLPAADVEITFNYNTAVVGEPGRQALSKVGAALVNPRLINHAFVIVGHTDAKGSQEYNQELSVKRAIATKEYLVTTYGIASERLHAFGRGKSTLKNPINPFASENRRVQIINVGAVASDTGRQPQRVSEGSSTRSFGFKEERSTAPLTIQIELPKRVWNIGETFSFTITASADCQFLVYTIDADGKVALHDPAVSGAFMGEPMLRAGERRMIPQPGAPGRARVDPPAGAYEIGAVCGLQDLERLKLGPASLKTPARSGRRSFSFSMDEAAIAAPSNELGRTTVSYDVR